MTDNAYEVDWSEHAGRLVAASHSDIDWYESVAAELIRPGDRVAADIGCGAAGMALTLAKAIGREGLVLAVDGNADVLAAARSRLDEALDAGAARVETVLANLDEAHPHDHSQEHGHGHGHSHGHGHGHGHGDGDAPGIEAVRDALSGGGADVIWASASVHHLADQQAGVSALAGLLAPGGRLALAEGGLKSRHLPWELDIGAPGLEMRFDLAQDTWFARMRAALPGSKPMPYSWTSALSRAGLIEVTTRSFLIEHPLPLAAATRDRLLSMLSHRVERLRETEHLVTPDDLEAWARLLDPDDPHWLGHRDDLYWLEVRSVHIGQRPR